MKISCGRPTFMKSLKKYPLVLVLLSGSGHLFQCWLQLKYTKVLLSHTSIFAALYGLTQQLSEKLQKLQNRAIRVKRVEKKAYFMYKCINNLAPASLCNLFAPRTPNYYFHNTKKKLMLPNPRTDYLKCSFSYSGGLLWNNLPEEIRTSNSLGLFKRSSHRWFSDQYSHTANM